ncbi:MAG: ferritin-like domain-containing protein [Halobacteria archaeon]
MGFLRTEPAWYDTRLQDAANLYSKAKKEQWNAETDVDWSAGPVYYTDNQRLAAARLLSQFLHGEQGALLVCGQLVHMVPDMDAKLYAASQVFDEARHVEVYARYLKTIGGVTPINKALAEILGEIANETHFEEKLIGMQILVEGLALRAFHGIREATCDPLLKQILAYTIKDEARHVAYGVMYLRRKISELTEQRRREIEQTVTGWAMRLGLVYKEEGEEATKILRPDAILLAETTKRMWSENRNVPVETIIAEHEKIMGPRPAPIAPGAPGPVEICKYSLSQLEKDPDISPEELADRSMRFMNKTSNQAIADATVVELRERLQNMGLFPKKSNGESGPRLPPVIKRQMSV